MTCGMVGGSATGLHNFIKRDSHNIPIILSHCVSNSFHKTYFVLPFPLAGTKHILLGSSGAVGALTLVRNRVEILGGPGTFLKLNHTLCCLRPLGAAYVLKAP